MRLLLAASLAALPFAAFAAGSDDSQPPTTTECKTGEVWDDKTSTCIKAEDSSLNDDQRYNAVRELAYAGRYPEALAMLDTMTEGDTARVMTYRGFALRRSSLPASAAMMAREPGPNARWPAPSRPA